MPPAPRSPTRSGRSCTRTAQYRACAARRASRAGPIPRDWSRGLSAEALQVCLDERIDVAVHDLMDVRFLQFRAVIVHHGIWLEHVTPNLAAEIDVGLLLVDFGLLRFTLGHRALVQPRFEHLHRRRLVLPLAALL